ncbi:hypothetical protein ACFCZR_24365 [Streptomyces rubiginosohelvolus]|uniref:hypothetical protein n=1 Tax=Streptomyces rubiginosohelvolus TaxID=67362 RepID=UPI0035DEEE5F
MGIHFTTVVVPAARSGADTDNAALIFGADTEDDIADLPLPVALHVLDNALQCFGPHGQMIGGPMPVSDAWIAAAAPIGDHAAQARVCVVLEPLPEQTGTSDVPVELGVPEAGLASWTGQVIAGDYRMAMRAVFVSTGSPLNVDSALHAPTRLPEWAHHMHTP